MYDFRIVLEREAARLIPTPVPPGMIEELARIQQQHDRASSLGDLFQVHTLNDEFHRTLFGACPNTTMRDAIVHYARRTLPVRMRFLYDVRRRLDAASEHWEMIDALTNGDAPLLAKVCARHLALRCAAYLKNHAAQRPVMGDSQ